MHVSHKQASAPRLPGHVGALIAAKAVTWKARARTAVILVLVGMTAYLLSVLLGLPINIWLSRLIGNPTNLSSFSKVLLGAVALDSSKFAVLSVLAFFVNRLLVVRPWVAALGITLSCYSFDAVLAWVLQDFPQTWMNWPALAGRLPLALVTWLVVFRLIRGTRSVENAGIGHGQTGRKDSHAPQTARKPHEQDSNRNTASN